MQKETKTSEKGKTQSDHFAQNIKLDAKFTSTESNNSRNMTGNTKFAHSMKNQMEPNFCGKSAFSSDKKNSKEQMSSFRPSLLSKQKALMQSRNLHQRNDSKSLK